MIPDRTPAEIIALTILTRDGVAAIWGLHLSAAGAYRDGNKAVAAGIIEIADAAESEWLRGQGCGSGIGALANLIARRLRPETGFP
jgi:hypothetical protein